MKAKTTLLALSGVVGSGVIGGLTYAAVSSPAAASSAGTSGATNTTAAGTGGSGVRHHLGRAGMLRRIEHGQLTLQTRKGDRTVDLQRGKVTAVSPTSISVKSPDGFTGTYAVTSTTKVRVARALAGISKVHDGDTVFVVASGGKALRVVDRA